MKNCSFLHLRFQLTTFLVKKYKTLNSNAHFKIGHFTVICSVTWPLNRSEAGGELALIHISLLYHGNANLVSIRTT